MVKKILVRTFLGLVLAFLYLPILWMILFSFTDTPSFNSWNGFSLQPYIDLFTGRDSSATFQALGNTFLIGISASAIATVLGTMAAIGINSISNKKYKKLFNSINQIPMVNSEIVTAVSLVLLFGIFRTFIRLEGNVQMFNVILAHVTFCTPYVVLNVLPRLKQSDNKIYEAALDLGCTPSQALWKVVIPDILPGIIMGMVMSFTLSIDDFVITQFNIDGFQTLSTLIYLKASGKKSLPPSMRALSSIIFVIILGLLLLMNSKSKDKSKDKITKKTNKLSLAKKGAKR